MMINIIIITLLVTWIINCIVVFISEEAALYVSMGLVYPVLWVLTYPVRAWKTYSSSKHYYERHNITRLQYIFGKRVNAFKQKGDGE